ncbi:hypothetical protein PR202_ga05992 [Eleusine coracana subsp. coracana]|uniref:GBF-interacting protein 1 N-terminal domain-containing protein n=1 Tax=Eleusine coracana subsp. coracana TaxID=191504 RepID=A0AAV5BTU4_ELECO|nr:hypothetical protein PR202_ga05992 [Eleusine coracana subsp. coracana]
MSGGGAGGKGAAAPVPAGASRKLVQSLKEIVNRPEAEIYAALRECGMDPDEAVSRLLSQVSKSLQESEISELNWATFLLFNIKETPEPRSRPANNSSSRGVRGGADRGGRNSSVHSNSVDNMASRSSVPGTGMPSTNSNQKQPVASSSVNKQMVADGPALPSQSSPGFQNSWSGTPGQLSMADIVKMGRPQPQAKHSSKPVVTADGGYTGQYPSLPSTVNQNPKQYASTAMPTELDQKIPSLQDSVQAQNSATDNKHTYRNDWTPQDEPTHANQSFLPETSVDPYGTSLHSSSQVDDVVNSHGNSHFDENALRPVTASERHLERDEVEGSNADVSTATANFQNLSLHNEELDAKPVTEDKPAVIIPDHLQVTNTDCAYLSFGSFESGAFSGFLPQKTSDSNVEMPVGGDTPVDQIDARNQDYYDTGAVASSANENLEAMMGASIENIDAPSVSQADVLRQDVLEPSGLQYDLPSVSSHTYSNVNTSQPSTMEEPQGNTQAHTLSHLSNLMTMKTGVFPNVQSPQNLPSTSIPTGPPPPQQLAAPAHPYSQHTVPLPPFTNMIGYPYLPQNYAAYLPSIFQQAYASNGPFHQSATAVPGSGYNSAMWLHGSGSRTAAALPPSHFYAYQGQSQQGGFRQAQQPQPSQFGGHGYPTYYSSQGGLTQEQHQPQNLAEGSLNGFQAAPSQQSHPSWQHQHTY